MNSRNIALALAAIAAFFFFRPKTALSCPGLTIFGRLVNGQSFQTCYHPENYPGINWIKVNRPQVGLVLIPVTEANNEGLIRVPDRTDLWIDRQLHDQLLAEYNRIRSELRGQLFSVWIQTALQGREVYNHLQEGEVQDGSVSTNENLQTV